MRHLKRLKAQQWGELATWIVIGWVVVAVLNYMAEL